MNYGVAEAPRVARRRPITAARDIGIPFNFLSRRRENFSSILTAPTPTARCSSHLCRDVLKQQVLNVTTTETKLSSSSEGKK